MSTWRQFAEEVQRENKGGANRDNRDNRDDSPENGPNGPIVPNVPTAPLRITDTQARAMLRHWHGRLLLLDPLKPPAGCDWWWRQAVTDSWWLYENYASRAVRDGWSALDLFGVMPAKPGWGGLVCRLRGARNLKVDADRAVWTVSGERERICRGGGDDLRDVLVLLWEVGL
jgi:hypothetical protein